MEMDALIGAAFAGLLNNLWIAVAIAAAAWALGRVLPRTNAATRHLVWWTVLAFLLVLPFVRPEFRRRADPAGWPVAATTDVADSAIEAATVPSARARVPLQVHPGDWVAVAIAAWTLFVVVQGLRLSWSFLFLVRVKRRAVAAPAVLDDRFRYWIAACGVRRPVRLLVSDRIASPLATGYRRPAVIVPAALLQQFGEAELEHVLLHELAHVARRDDWSTLLARCVGAVVGWHPVAAWTLYQIARERELACDDWVVARTGQARTYAASLARLFEVCRSQRRLTLATGMASHLGTRIETLLATGRQFQARSSLPRIVVTTGALLALMVAGAHAPKWIVLAQTVAPGGDNPRPVNPYGSFLAALVAAGYGNLAVDDIIGLKEHGIDARFLAELSQSGWEKLTPRDMINMHDNGVPPEMLRALREAGFQHMEIRPVIEAWEQGVRPGTLRDAAQYGTHLTLPQIVKLKQAGVI